MNNKTNSSVGTSDTQERRIYQAPALTRLPLEATLGGAVPTCDSACGIADNTFSDS